VSHLGRIQPYSQTSDYTEKVAKDKRSSLIRTFVNYRKKRFITLTPGWSLGEAPDVGVALVAGVAGAKGSMPSAVNDAGGVVAALVDAARVQRTHL
jgi:hypothetical protein